MTAKAAEDATASEGVPAPQVVRVEKIEPERPKHPTLGFLDENRDFFRARLDYLRVSLGPRSGEATEIDARFLRWREMLAEIDAAADTTGAAEAWIRQRELMDSVADLLALETAMDSMEALLDEQTRRLVELEEDFTGRQRTALVVLLTGVPVTGIPTSVALIDPDGDDFRVALGEPDRLALERGGTIELSHRLAEPRAHRLSVRLEGSGAVPAGEWPVALDLARDRLTFVEIDLGGFDPEAGVPLPVRNWVR